MPIQDAIEAHLREAADWVSAETLCDLFGLPEPRSLRQVKGHPGLCSNFAISGDRGFKHVAAATTREWLTFKHRLRKHAISEMVRVRHLDRRRSTCARPLHRPAITLEKDSSQILLPFSSSMLK